jgi:hypothetical protein
MSECINHVGRFDDDGYGLVWKDGRQWRAHRLAWCEAFGSIAKGLMVLHSCDNPSCVNIDHLRLGTAQDNHNDRRLRERSPWGEKTNRAILSEDDVVWIRKVRAIGVMSSRDTARAFDVSQGAVQNIVKRRTWPHVA